MGNKVNVVLIVLSVLFFGLNIFQFVWWNNTNKKLSESYTSEIASLEQTIAGYGTEVTVYTVSSAVKAGDEILEENIEPMKMYSSLLTEQYVTDISDIIGRYFKIAVNPGTPIMFNMAMDEELDDTVRDHDILLDSIPVGTEVGDYIDIRITFPYGDDYIVLSHKRIYGISENTIKLYMTEYEWNVYLGALVDYYINESLGTTIYGVKYVEPGIQQDAIAYYSVPTNIQTLLQKNPNIIDKEGAASLNAWRESLEAMLVLLRNNEDTIESDGEKFSSGRDAYNEAIEDDRATAAEEAAEQAEMEAEQNVDNTSSVSDDFWTEDIDSSTGGEDIAN